MPPDAEWLDKTNSPNIVISMVRFWSSNHRDVDRDDAEFFLGAFALCSVRAPRFGTPTPSTL